MKNLIKTAIAASVLASSSAMAIGVEFDYIASLEFTPSETTSNTGASIFTNNVDQLVWGTAATNAGRSSLTIGDAVDNTAPDTVAQGTTSGGVGIGNSLTHQNYPIFNPLLTSGQLVDNLTLYEENSLSGTPVEVYKALELTLNFSFLETPNSGTCAGGTGLNGWGSDPNNTAFESCPDLWAIDPAGSSSLAAQAFQYDGIDYLLQVVILDENGAPLVLADQALLPEECDALGLGQYPSCVGFRTGENLDTTRIFGFQVSQVPVPAAVWLFGSALLGFAGYSRRKNKS